MYDTQSISALPLKTFEFVLTDTCVYYTLDIQSNVYDWKTLCLTTIIIYQRGTLEIAAVNKFKNTNLSQFLSYEIF